MNPGPRAAVILDLDGVVSPVHGHTAWGDDQIAGDMFGPVLVSPALNRRLTRLGDRPDVICAWLTDWSLTARMRVTGVPGRDWLDLGLTWPLHGRHHATDWWKPRALRTWLDGQAQLERLVWCDDHIDPAGDDLEHLGGERIPPSEPAHGTTSLAVRTGDVEALLLVPETRIGLTPADVGAIESFVGLPAAAQ